MGALEIFEDTSWDTDFSIEEQDRAVDALEAGEVLYFRHLAFPLEAQEQRFLSDRWSDKKAKNISFDARVGKLGGAEVEGADATDLSVMLSRYAATTRQFLIRLVPGYSSSLMQARTSFRAQEIAGRPVSSYRKDDTRLHSDAFPSRPTRGARILRVFTNINPVGKPRVWHVGEPFESFADRFLPRVARPIPGLARVEALLGITKGERTLYDHIMLQLHDHAKGDDSYQREAPRTEIAFPPNSTWIVFTDQVPHAALSGQFVLEQTFQLPVTAQRRPELSPLRVLERLTGKSLA